MTWDILLNDILSDGAGKSRVSFMACRHSGRHVYVALGCVFDYATIACALRWGVALVGDYHYWALLTPSWDPPFRYMSAADG